jgi:diguanylate cyclase (GGDEF)-like protein
LTLTPNRRWLECALERELARTARTGQPLSLVLFDVDLFKAVNDQLGHLGGDATLRQLAARVESVLRKGDFLARYGGDEFAILLPFTSASVASRISERVRNAVAKHVFTHEGREYRITISAGVAVTRGAQVKSPEQLLQIADARLYGAKQAGRDCVSV